MIHSHTRPLYQQAPNFNLRFAGICTAGVLWLEFGVHFYVYGLTFSIGTVLMILFSLSLGTFISVLCSIWRPRVNRILLSAVFLLLTLYAGMQTVYYSIFKTYLILYSIGQGGGKILQFWREAVDGIFDALPMVLFLFVPFVLSCLFANRVIPKDRVIPLRALAGVAAAVMFYGISILIIFTSNTGIMPLRYIYKDSYIPQLTVQRFGLFTTFRLDVQSLLAPRESKAAAVMELDAFVESQTQTPENEYTGMFEGKNLIWITAESFSSWAIDERLTPTLYRLAGSGFVCTNFYNPIWWISTSDGEYVPLSGLLPVSGTWSLLRSSQGEMPLVMGNQLRELGYRCYAYHNHDYSYYNRNISHPAYGYDFSGIGNGLEAGVSDLWPESDLEMIEYTAPQYIGGDTPFHVYYMTVSGHLNYAFDDNAMAKKNMEAVASLPYSEPAKAYLACNIELDRALESLLTQLEQAGKLDDTLIVLSGDHYPYALDDGALEELNGGEIDDPLEIYRSTLILWNSGIKEPVNTDKLCSTLDLLPTISNLMGVPYDSRLLMGRDIFSDSPGFVIFRNRSFITDEGRYDADTDVFTPSEGSRAGDEYAREILSDVIKRFDASERIIFNDYYGILERHTT